MKRIFWVEKDRLAGRCGPSVTPWDLGAFRAAGFRYLLSLDAREHRLIGGKTPGIETGLIHLTDSIPPLPLEVQIYEKRLPEAVDLVIRWLAEDRGSVLVHCHAGNDRTGGVLTGYLSRNRGLPPREALARVREANPDAVSAEGYEAMILELLEKEYKKNR